MTKRLLTAVASLLLLANVSYGQKLHYGLKADLQFTSLHGEGMKGNFSPGYDAGIFVEYNFTSKLGIQPEVLFSQFNNKKGDDFMKYYVNSGNSSAKSAVKLSYLSVPVLLAYNVNKLFTINVGPQFSMLLYDNEDLLVKDRAAFKNTDFGAVAGLTLHVSGVRFYGRYVLGLGNINDVDSRYSWHSQQIQVGLGVAIR
ncbi:MAG TPA: porin family protein [Chitinophaga sp.]|uniref:porin family protein n=1 Tax=Chitinophaga sp. TaxID=1869181 RepID=UPI002DBEC437|nr:porin family protein [Chitinophaga sp.]HEU4551337.1 porin family protein [Chitinophaga sp.]